jgi:soluble lytic murein transglycosylase-like protein
MSITSMNARMGMAEKLDIPQLTRAVQDGTVPSYIGIPLIQQKMQESQQAKAMAQPKAPPIAQQVMQQAQAMQGVPALPSNMPEEYAQGGILSYAGGGDLYDDEDYDPEDEAQAYALSQGEDLMDQLVSNPDMYEYSSGPGIESLREVKSSPSGKSFEAKEAKVQVGDGTSEKLLKHILHKESRGQRYDKEGNLLTSSKGALGEMQVMPATARDPGFGIAPARSNDPDELRRVGEEYAKVLLNKYRDPKLAAIAYNMGPGNTDKWLAAGADISKLPQETRGYVQGMAGGGAVHFDGGGITDVFNMTPDEVKEYAKRKLRLEQLKSAFGSAPASAAPAAGTGIAPAAAPSFMESAKNAVGRLNPRGLVGYGSLFHTEDLNKGEQEELDKRWKQAYESPAETARLLRQNATATGTPVGQVATSQAAPSTPRMPDTTADNIDMGGGQNFGATQAAAQAAPAEQAVQANPMSGIEELLNKREAGLGKQRDIDNYMSLLSAGLGMMGGTSPFAAANIGQGAQAGIKTYGDAAARRVAEENAILSGRLGAYKYAGSRAQADAMMALRKDLQNQQLGYNRERLAQTGKEHDATLAQRVSAKQLDLIKNEQDRALATAAKLVGDNPAALSMSDTQKAEAVRKMADSLLMQNKMYRTSHIKEYGADPFADMGGGGGGTRLKFDAQGQQIK